MVSLSTIVLVEMSNRPRRGVKTMDAKIMIGSGRSTRGQQMGCTDDQCYALILDVSTRDESDCYPELYVSGPWDDGRLARAEVRKWAKANGVEIAGNFQPRVITGADADVRANTPRRF